MARADEFGTEIDLTTFGESRLKERPSAWEEADLQDVDLRDVGIQDVGLWNEGAGRRFYISGMLGPSFAGLAQGGVVGNGISPQEVIVLPSATPAPSMPA